MKNSIAYSLTTLVVCAAMIACSKNSDGGAPANPLKPGTGPAKSASAPSGDNTKATQIKTGAPDMKAVVPSAKTIADVQIPNPPTSADFERMREISRQYSAASNDALRILATRDQAAEQDENQRNENLRLATSIQSASLRIDFGGTGDTALTLVTGEDPQNSKKLVLFGTIEDGAATLTNRNRKITANIRCMDMTTQTCENSVAEVRVNNAVARIIFRRSNVEWIAQFPNRNCYTQECENIYALAKHTEFGSGDRNSQRFAKLETTEVIEGRSSFRFLLVTNESQVISIAGPLLDPSRNPMMNVVTDRTLSVEDMTDPSTFGSYRTDMQNSMTDVRLVSNNGSGKIGLKVQMRILDDGRRDEFNLNLKRIQLPVRLQNAPLPLPPVITSK